MKNTILNFLMSFISIVFVMIGAYFLSFYVINDISFTSIILGLIGYFIISPATDKWENYFKGFIKK